MIPVESGAQDSRCGCPHLDTASTAKLGHCGDPGDLDMKFSAHLLKRLGDGRIGIFSQKYTFRTFSLEGFFELFGPDNDLAAVHSGFSPALGYFTYFFLIHTKTYYTQFF